MTYNGYSNYETWNAALWIDNDESVQSSWAGRAQELRNDNSADDATYHLSKELQSDFDDNAPNLGSNVYADLLQSAIGEINWYEIAENMIAETSAPDVELEEVE